MNTYYQSVMDKYEAGNDAFKKSLSTSLGLEDTPHVSIIGRAVASLD